MSLQKPRRILLADPSNAFRSLYFSVLNREGFEVTGAATIKTLFDMLARLDFDLIVLDPSLIGNEGTSLIRKLCNHISASKIILLSSISNPRWVELASELGISDYLIKNQTSPNALVTRLDEIITWTRFDEFENSLEHLPIHASPAHT